MKKIVSREWHIANTENYMKTPTRQDICGDNEDLQKAYDHLFFSWNAEDFFRAFSQLFSECIEIGGEPTIITVLRKGLGNYSKLLSDPDVTYFPHERLTGFLTGCFEEASSLCCYSVEDEQTEEHWDILNDLPLSLWRHNRGGLRVVKSDVQDEEFYRILYIKVVPNNMKLVMKRFSHEKALLAGPMANRN